MIKLHNLNAAINRAMNALRSKQVKANQDARAMLRKALASLNEARLLLNAGDMRGAYWMALQADLQVRNARQALQ